MSGLRAVPAPARLVSTGLTAGRTLGMLALLALPLPVTLVCTAAALATGRRPGTGTGPATRTGAAPRTVMVGGGKMTKALTLARAFASSGHRVVLVETGAYARAGHRNSRPVDRFHTVPEPTDPGYARTPRTASPQPPTPPGGRRRSPTSPRAGTGGSRTTSVTRP